MDYKERFWKDLASGRFASMVRESSKGRALSSSLAAYHVLKPLFAKEDDVEKAFFIFLDGQNRIIEIENMFSGSITASHIYTREVVKRLIALKATAMVVGHNHPSGDTVPSDEDQSITIKLGIAAASIDVELHDHIIVGDGYYSMADSGWLKGVKRRFLNLINLEPTKKGETS